MITLIKLNIINIEQFISKQLKKKQYKEQHIITNTIKKTPK